MNSPKKVYYSPACGNLLVKVAPQDVGMFRFLLEARDNLALFTVLEPKLALLKLSFAPESKETVFKALVEIKRDLKLDWQEWPIKKAE